jgi:lipoprotein-anchoring transpeptidase ErfK/SrfK
MSSPVVARQVAVSRVSAVLVRGLIAGVLAWSAFIGGAAASVAHATPPQPLIPPPTIARSYIAHVLVPTVARTKPSASAPAVTSVGTSTQWAHGPVRLLVLGSARVASGRLWLLVRLPIRPNTARGWIPADDAAVGATSWWIQVDTKKRNIAVVRNGVVVRQAPVVIGKPSTPTPTGLFAIYERARQPSGSDLGPWALHLTAHSNVLFDFGGGPGRVALHGRAGDLLADPLGTAASHGCVRMDDDVISWIAGHVQAGTPVMVL